MSLVLTAVYSKGDRYNAVVSALSIYINGTKEPEWVDVIEETWQAAKLTNWAGSADGTSRDWTGTE